MGKKLTELHIIVSFNIALALMDTAMEQLKNLKEPFEEEQKTAMESYDALTAALKELSSKNPEIEVEETREKIKIPLKALY